MHLAREFEIFPCLAFIAWAVQQSSRMIRDYDRGVDATAMDRTPQPVERPVERPVARHQGAEQPLSCHRTERQDDPRPNHRYLLQKMATALYDLLGAHFAIARWPTSQRTGDKYGIARQTDRAQHGIE